MRRRADAPGALEPRPRRHPGQLRGVDRHRARRRRRPATSALAVDDQGPGVPPDVRIFDDFFTTRTHGAGIGLAVVRRILEDHAPMGARLTVEKAAGGGASFRVTLSRDVSGLKRSLRPPAITS